MIWVVKSICGKLTGSYIKIYINRFCTLMELLIELYDILLFDTGTIVDNSIQK